VSSLTAILGASRVQTRDFLHWWTQELWGLLPARARRYFAGAGGELVLVATDDGYKVLESTGAPADAASVLSQAQALDAVRSHLRTRPHAAVVVRIPVHSCFHRTTELPSAARADVGRILDLDLGRSMPFRLEDVYTSYYVEPRAPGAGKIKVHQLVAKRAPIDALLTPLEAAGARVAAVDCWHGDVAKPLPVDFLAAREGRQASRATWLTAPRVLGLAVALLAACAVAVGLWRSQSALEDLQTRVGAARERAAAVRRLLESSNAVVGEVARLQRRKMAHTPAVVILDELARALPDSVWVTELRRDGDTLDISGLAKSGASLPSLFERSPLFSDATMTAPLTLDPQEDKERFSLRVRIRRQDQDPPAAADKTR